MCVKAQSCCSGVRRRGLDERVEVGNQRLRGEDGGNDIVSECCLDARARVCELLSVFGSWIRV